MPKVLKGFPMSLISRISPRGEIEFNQVKTGKRGKIGISDVAKWQCGSFRDCEMLYQKE